MSVLVTHNGTSKPLVSGTKIRLSFADGKLGVSAGCNSMSGEYDVVGGKLVAGQMMSTEIGCPGDLADQDTWVSDFLATKPAVQLDGNDLMLTSTDTEITFLDREQAEPDQPLTGITWGLTTLIDGDAASSIPVGMNVTFLFDKDGTFTFNDGCNSGGGEYATNGDRITFSQVVTTDMACDTTPEHSAVTTAVDDMFTADDVTFELDHTTLSLQAGDHGLLYDAAVDVN